MRPCDRTARPERGRGSVSVPRAAGRPLFEAVPGAKALTGTPLRFADRKADKSFAKLRKRKEVSTDSGGTPGQQSAVQRCSGHVDSKDVLLG